MAKQDDPRTEKRRGLLATPGIKWSDLPGTTLALTSLAILGAAAVMSTPFWVLYRRKRKRVDKLIDEAPAAVPSTGAEPQSAAPADDEATLPTESNDRPPQEDAARPPDA
jgi:hypothetical protein